MLQKVITAALCWLCISLNVTADTQNEEKTFKIGVIAFRGHQNALERWTPVANYLSAHAGYKFTIVPLYLNEIRQVVGRNEIDFLISNPGTYVVLEEKGMTRLATLKNLWHGKVLTEFGGVIFTKASNTSIKTIKDIKGHSVMAVERESFGGYNMELLEFKRNGLDPERDFKRFSFSGFPQDEVVYAVRDGKIDVGTVRTDTLERMAEAGKVDLKMFKIINQYEDDFPFVRSTPLYPELVFASAKHVPNSIAGKVALILLNMPANSPAAVKAGIAGWAIPKDYQIVRDVLKEINIWPEKRTSFFEEHRVSIIAITLAGIILVIGIVYIVRLKQKNNKAQLLIEKLSGIDKQSGLAARPVFEERLISEWNRALVHHSLLSMIVVDIDGFRAYNDHYGAVSGDEIIHQVGGTIAVALMHMPLSLVARYHDDTFAVLIPSLGADDVCNIAQSISKKVDELKIPNEPGETYGHITVSCGATTVSPNETFEPQDLIISAQNALRKAVTQGGNGAYCTRISLAENTLEAQHKLEIFSGG